MLTAVDFVREHHPLPPYSVLEEVFSTPSALVFEPDFSLRQTLRLEHHSFPVQVPDWIERGTLMAMSNAVKQGAARFPGEINDMGHLHVVLYERHFPNMYAQLNRPYYPPEEIYDPEKCAGLLFHTQEFINGQPFGLSPSRCNVFYSTAKDEAFVFEDPRNPEAGDRFATRTSHFNLFAKDDPAFIQRLGIEEVPVIEPDHGLYFHFARDKEGKPALKFLRESSPTQEEWGILVQDSMRLAMQATES